MPTIDGHLNTFAIRSFRDTADNDYITARLALRSKLIPQFLWCGLQALEKYLKCIMVLNRIPAGRGHDLGQLLDAYKKSSTFELRITPASLEFIKFLDTYGRHRYFEGSWFIEGAEIVALDQAVWEIRRYARVMSYRAAGSDGKVIDMLTHELAVNAAAEDKHPQEFAVQGGLLEQIIANMKHPARQPLIWQNGYFGKSRRRSVRLYSGLHLANSPLTLNPKLLDEVLKYVWLPKDMVSAYRNAT